MKLCCNHATYVSTYVYVTSTCPNDVNDLLMATASTSLCPVSSVLDILSEPARSTNVSLPCVTALFIPSTDIYNMRCDLELQINNIAIVIS